MQIITKMIEFFDEVLPFSPREGLVAFRGSLAKN
jgi:hypothetical protein